MGLTGLNQLYVYDYSLQVLSQDLLTASVFFDSQVGRDLRSLALGLRQERRSTDITGMALTGTLRADAATLRQAGDNIREAASVFSTGATALDSIETKLERMLEIAQGVDDGSLTRSAVQAEYDDLIGEIEAIVDNTTFNGISLFDTSDWATDDRVTVSGDSGQIFIQSDLSGGSNISLTNLRDDLIGVFNGGDDLVDDGAEDLDASILATTISNLSTLETTIEVLGDSYEARASNLEFQATGVDNQADVFDTAAANRMQSGTTSDPVDALIDLILATSGSIVNSSS